MRSGGGPGRSGGRAASAPRRRDETRAAPRALAARIAASRRRQPSRSVRAVRAARWRRGAGRTLLALLVEFLANPLALEVGEIVDEQLAVEMIHLVLDADRKDVVVVALEHGAGAVLRAHPHLRRALHLIEDARHGETPFLGARLAL